EPFAAASLGQVHHAVTKRGEGVAVKIQYPGIQAAVSSDFKLLRGVLAAPRVSGHVPRGAMSEIERQIVAETDYVREAANAEFLGERLAPLAYVRVPRIYREYSSDRVL